MRVEVGLLFVALICSLLNIWLLLLGSGWYTFICNITLHSLLLALCSHADFADVLQRGDVLIALEDSCVVSGLDPGFT